MTASMVFVSRPVVLLGMLATYACAAERPSGAYDLSPWKVGDKWVVHVNARAVRDAVLRGTNDDRKIWFEKMRERWETEGKPKGIRFDEWLEKQGASAAQVKPSDIPEAHASPPYEDWMLCDQKSPDVAYGPYLSDWASWRFEVLSEDKVGICPCFRVRATMVGWVDAAGKPAPEKQEGGYDDLSGSSGVKSVPQETKEDKKGAEDKRNNEKKEPPPAWQAILFFSASDRSLLRLEVCRGADAKHNEEFGGGWPVKSLQIRRIPTAISLPAYFPALGLWSKDPVKTAEAERDDRRTALAGAVAQVCSLLPDKRILIMTAQDMEAATKAPPGSEYAKFLFKKDLPWWTEAYVLTQGGVRARLFSVNDEPIVTRLTPQAPGKKSE